MPFTFTEELPPVAGSPHAVVSPTLTTDAPFTFTSAEPDAYAVW